LGVVSLDSMKPIRINICCQIDDRVVFLFYWTTINNSYLSLVYLW
jgi:hypothetical protein